LAIALGNVDAYHNLARLYEVGCYNPQTGDGVKKDPDMAFKYFRQGAQRVKNASQVWFVSDKVLD
jgi:TPR repeat protein